VSADVIEAAVLAWREWDRSPEFPLASHRLRGYCINSTRIGVEALRLLGVKARPTSVSMLVANDAGWDLATRGVDVDEWPAHAWSVGAGFDDAGDGGAWNGHLILTGDGFALDLSAKMFHRPEHGIWLDGPLHLAADLTDDGLHLHRFGVHVDVCRRPEFRRWRTAPGWTDRRPELSAEYARRIRDVLDRT
jgi:hypothetical protein